MRVALAQERVSVPFLDLRAIHEPVKDRILRKNLGAMGDAGAVVTDDSEVAASVRTLREHGQGNRYEHLPAGWTSRVDTLQAAVLLRKLPLLEAEAVAREGVSLPLNAGLRDEQVAAVAEATGDYFDHG
jgi:dTDP-4-amino-4,6-dideoxygalactose transaminase